MEAVRRNYEENYGRSDEWNLQGMGERCQRIFDELRKMQSQMSSALRHQRHAPVELENRKVLKVETFDGTENVDAFLEKFQTCAEYNEWDSYEQLVHLKLCLKGKAQVCSRDAERASRQSSV